MREHLPIVNHSREWDGSFRDDHIPPHGESSASIGRRILGTLELMSKLKSVSVVSVEHRGVGASSAFPTLGCAGIPASSFTTCTFSLKTSRSIMDADRRHVHS